jgi:hypothetical protein
MYASSAVGAELEIVWSLPPPYIFLAYVNEHRVLLLRNVDTILPAHTT